MGVFEEKIIVEKNLEILLQTSKEQLQKILLQNGQIPKTSTLQLVGSSQSATSVAVSYTYRSNAHETPDIDPNTLTLPTSDSSDILSEDENNEEWQISRSEKRKRTPKNVKTNPIGGELHYYFLFVLMVPPPLNSMYLQYCL